MTDLELAILFHETYERLAPSFGYETRTDTRVFDPQSKNGKLMVAVCGELLAKVGDDGWKQFYALRKSVGDARYPGMTGEIMTTAVPCDHRDYHQPKERDIE